MSYRLDLDEYDVDRLVEELRHRGDQLAQGLCDYCGRAPDAEPCRMKDRHTVTDAADASRALHDAGDRKGWDASKRMNEPCAFINSLGLGSVFQDWLNKRPR